MLKKLFKNKTSNFYTQLLRYTFVGGMAFLVDAGALIFLTEIVGIHYLTSAAISFTAGLLFNYILSIKWVFSARSFDNKYLELLLFTLIGIVGLGLNELIMWFVTEKIHLHYTLSKCSSAFVVYMWNFLIRRVILFRNKANGQ